MAARSRTAVRLVDTLSRPQPSKSYLKTQARPSTSSSNNTSQNPRHQHQPQHRQASTATAHATVETPPLSQISPSSEVPISPQTQSQISVHAGVVLSRPPLITPDPHPFDTAYHLYQKRLNERLVLPFSQYFHYKRGTPTFEAFRRSRKERGGVAARDIGKYNAYTNESWNDEVLVGDRTGEMDEVVGKLIEEEGRAGEFVGRGEGQQNEGEMRLAGLRRRTAADEKEDVKDLERALSRTLYLLVRRGGKGGDGDGQWVFPSGEVEVKEGLKEAAIRILQKSAGVNMNTWFVASHPIGHYNQNMSSDKESKSEMEVDMIKTFFMKARIFAGQADLKNNSFGLGDFKWLAKEEIQQHVSEQYWKSVQHMLVEQ